MAKAKSGNDESVANVEMVAGAVAVPETLVAKSLGCRADIVVRLEFPRGKNRQYPGRDLNQTRIEVVGTGPASQTIESRVLQGRTVVRFDRLPNGTFDIRVVPAPGVKVTGGYWIPDASQDEDTQKAQKRPQKFDEQTCTRVTVQPPQTAILVVEVNLESASLKCFAYVDPDCAWDQPLECECRKLADCDCDQSKKTQQPIKGVPITLRIGNRNARCESTGEDGTIQIGDLDPGLYEVSPPSTFQQESGDQCTYHLAYNGPVFVQLSPGQTCCTLPVRYCLDEAAICVSTIIEGQSECESATLCDGEFMLFRDCDPEFLRCENGSHGEPAVFSGLAPGTYILTSGNAVMERDGKTYELRSPRHGAIRVRVCAGQRVDLCHQFRFALVSESQRATEISGRVTDQQGDVVTHQLVELLQARTDYVLWTSVTDANGRYAILWQQWAYTGELELRIGKTRVRVPRNGLIESAADTLQQLQS